MIPRSEEVQRLTWAASQMVSREMPYTVLKGLLLRLVLTTTNGAAAALSAIQLAGAISELRIKINGSDTRVAMSGEQIFIQNYYDFSKAPQSSIDTAAGAGKTQAITLYLPFALTRAVRPEDSVLDLRKMPPVNPVSTAYMEVNFGSATGMGSDITITSGYLYVQTIEYSGAGERPFIAIHEFSHMLFPVSATGKNRIMLDVGGINEYRRLYLLAKNAAGAFSDVQIDKVAIRSRAFTWVDCDSQVLQDRNAQEYSMTPLTGVYIIDFTTDGLMSQRLDAKKLDELVIEPNALLTGGTLYVLKEKAIYLSA